MALREVFMRFTTKVDDRALKKGKKSTEDLTGSLKTLATTLGAAVLGSAVKTFLGNQIEMANSFRDVSTQLGISSESFQTWLALAKRAGVDISELKEVMLDVAERAGDAATGNKTYTESFRAMGVSIKDANGNLKTTDVLFGDVIEGLNGMSDRSAKLFRARELSGQFNRLFPLIEQTTESLEAQKKELRESGAIMRKDYSDGLLRIRDRLETAKQQFAGLLIQGLKPLLGPIEELFSKVKDGIKWFRKMTEGVDLARIGMLALATASIPLLIKGFTLLLSPITLIILGIGAAILVVDELITAYKGGKSVIADFFQEHFNYDITKFLDILVKLWGGIRTAIDVAWGGLEVFIGGAITGIGFIIKAVQKLVGLLGSALGGLGKAAKFLGLDSVAKVLKSGADRSNSRVNSAGSAADTLIGAGQNASGKGAFRAVSSYANRQAEAQLTIGNAAASRRAAQNNTITQNVNVNATGMTPKQAEVAVRKAMEGERRAAIAAFSE